MDALPLILLGIRTAFKLDISSTSAELVYGTTPGEFFDSSSVACSDSNDYVSQFKCHLQSIRPKPPQPTSHSSHVVDGLATATHVFGCCDGIHTPLQPPYEGPFPVVKCNDTFFTLL